MQFVIFNKETTMYLRVLSKKHWKDARFATEAAANACLTRWAKKMAKDGKDFNQDDYDILPQSEFDLIEKWETKKNMMSGGEFTQRVNTPSYCDPSCESYWSA